MQNSGLRRVKLVLMAITAAGLGGCLGGGGGGAGAPFGGAGSEFGAQAGLAHIAAAAPFAAGYTGDAVRVGIVDSGVDGGHSEFSGRITAGGDWQGGGNGLSDPNGHGTHVASIVAAAADGVGMQGVAPQAELYSYRILDSAGRMAGQTSETIMPDVVSQMRQQRMQIVNNSWGSGVAIDDVPADTISSVLPRELSAWSGAVGAGMVMVWAAGNEAGDEVSVRAGLPYYYSHLRSGWLTVVSSGAAGTEPYYTNRCGLAADWCITAPGGGDNQAQSGVFAARSGGGYIRKSGTSMAAPHISGGLAVILDAFPTLTPQAAARRMLATANHDGLVAANGCTLASCGASYMRSVFGAGQMDLSAALSPVLPLSVQVNNTSHDLASSRLTSSPVLYHGLYRALDGLSLRATDPFDGAEFKLNSTALLSPPPYQPVRPRWSAAQTSASDSGPVLAQGHTRHYLLSQEQPSFQGGAPARLTSLSARQPALRYVADHQNQRSDQLQTGLTVQAGFAEDSNSLSLTRYWRRPQTSYWAGQGVSTSENNWLDSSGTAALTFGESRQIWHFAGITTQFGKTTLQAEALLGNSQMQAPHSVLQRADTLLSSWEVSATYGLSDVQSLRASLYQPLRIERGSVQLADTALSGASEQSLSVPGREYQLHFGWHMHKAGSLDLSLFHGLRFDAGHLAGEPDHMVGAALKWIL